MFANIILKFISNDNFALQFRTEANVPLFSLLIVFTQLRKFPQG